MPPPCQVHFFKGKQTQSQGKEYQAPPHELPFQERSPGALRSWNFISSFAWQLATAHTSYFTTLPHPAINRTFAKHVYWYTNTHTCARPQTHIHTYLLVHIDDQPCNINRIQYPGTARITRTFNKQQCRLPQHNTHAPQVPEWMKRRLPKCYQEISPYWLPTSQRFKRTSKPRNKERELNSKKSFTAKR